MHTLCLYERNDPLQLVSSHGRINKTLLEVLDSVSHGPIPLRCGLFRTVRSKNESMMGSRIIDELGQVSRCESSFKMLTQFGREALIGFCTLEKDRAFDLSSFLGNQTRRMSNDGCAYCGVQVNIRNQMNDLLCAVTEADHLRGGDARCK